MKNKFFRTALAVVLGLGISLSLVPGALAVNDVTFPQTSYFYLSGVSETITVDSGASVDTFTVGTSTIAVTLGSGGGMTLRSPSKYIMTASPTAVGTGTCGPSSYDMVLATATTQTVTVTVSTTACSSGSGSSGGATVLPSPSASPSPSVSPSPSPSVSPSPSASPSPSPSASPSPSPTPLDLVPIPTLPANPTVPELQAAITAIQHNIAVLLAEITRLQQTDSTLFGNDLYYGLKGNSEVVRLQKFLIGKGYLSSGYATGHYLSLTVQAVKAYQLANGITPVNGRCGPKTRASINADLGL